MKRVKITVLKTTLDRELAEEYGAEGLTACPMLREGQVVAFIGFPIGGVLGLSPVTHRGIISAVTPIALPGG